MSLAVGELCFAHQWFTCTYNFVATYLHIFLGVIIHIQAAFKQIIYNLQKEKIQVLYIWYNRQIIIGPLFKKGYLLKLCQLKQAHT
jgi:hypothetical protein